MSVKRRVDARDAGYPLSLARSSRRVSHSRLQALRTHLHSKLGGLEALRCGCCIPIVIAGVTTLVIVGPRTPWVTVRPNSCQAPPYRATNALSSGVYAGYNKGWTLLTPSRYCVCLGMRSSVDGGGD